MITIEREREREREEAVVPPSWRLGVAAEPRLPASFCGNSSPWPGCKNPRRLGFHHSPGVGSCSCAGLTHRPPSPTRVERLRFFGFCRGRPDLSLRNGFPVPIARLQGRYITGRGCCVADSSIQYQIIINNLIDILLFIFHHILFKYYEYDMNDYVCRLISNFPSMFTGGSMKLKPGMVITTIYIMCGRCLRWMI